MAIREILDVSPVSVEESPTVECISQSFCCGIDHETVKEYCESVPRQTKYEVSKGSCRSNSCDMTVPPTVIPARKLGWVNTKNGKGWRCSHCTKAHENVKRQEVQLKNDIAAASKSELPILDKDKLVNAIQGIQRRCWRQGVSQEDKRNLLLKDKGFVKCSTVLFQLYPGVSFTCQDNTLIWKCPGTGRSTSCPHCTIILLSEANPV